MSNQPSVTRTGSFGRMPDGTNIDKWEFDNGSGLRAEVAALGGTILRLFVPDKHGQSTNVLLGVDSPEPILNGRSPYIGSLVGRVGNRIRNGRFTLDGKEYTLGLNAPPNHLHGGFVGYDKRLWHIEPVASADGAAIKLSLTDPAGTEGYPGTVEVSVVYTLTTSGAWRIDYEATALDAATPINLTQHAYFNLRDAGRDVIDDHILRIHAEQYTPLDADLLPTGQVAPVAGTLFDFRTPKPIGRDLRKTDSTPVGFDRNFVIDGPAGTLRPAAQVYEPRTGRVMDVLTTEPGMQFYSGNFLDGTVLGHDGFPYRQHAGFCLETQQYPDAPNQPSFPDSILRPGKTYRSTTEYRFSVRT